MAPPETEQMAALSDAAAARERRRTSKVRTSETFTIEGEIVLDDLRHLVEHTRGWNEDAHIEIREHKSYPGEPGSTPAQIKVTRN